MKRWAILCSFLGVFVFLVNTNQIKKFFFRYLLLFIVVGFLITMFFGNIFIQQLQNRNIKNNADYLKNEEGRSLDYIYFLKYIKDDGTINDILFGGSRLFDTRDFGLKYHGQYRNIHPDIISINYSLGFVGFLLYIFIISKIYINFKYSINNCFKKKHKLDIALFYSLYLMSIFIFLGGGLFRETTSTSIAFIYLGAITNIIRRDL